MGAIFLGSWFAQSVTGRVAYSEQQLMDLSAPVSYAEYLTNSDFWNRTLQNWQSEFLQLIWHVAGLSLLLHVGSPQSREADDRLEEKIDAILRAVSPEEGERIIGNLDQRFDKGEPVA